MVPMALAIQRTDKADMAKRIELRSSMASRTQADPCLSSMPPVEGLSKYGKVLCHGFHVAIVHTFCEGHHLATVRALT